MSRGGLVVVSPHLDDAVLSAWSLLSAHPGARVVTCFAGTPGDGVRGTWDAATGSGPARRTMELRLAEDRRALAGLGAEPVHLDLLDEQYRPEGDHAAGELARALGPHLRDAAQVWLPAALGGHGDHVLARDAGLAVAGASGSALHLYADLPYAAQPAWPAAVAPQVRHVLRRQVLARLGRPRPEDLWRATLAGTGLGERLRGPVVRRLSGPQRRAKTAAVRCYGTQLAALGCGPRHRLRESGLFGLEVHWRVEG